MRLRALFLFLTLVTVILVIAQLTGSNVINLIIIMAALDFLALGASIEVERKSHMHAQTSSKIESIEKVCKDIYDTISSNPGLEKMQKQREDISAILDRITKNSLELEERINKFGQVLSKSKNTSEQPSSVGEVVYIEEEKE